MDDNPFDQFVTQPTPTAVDDNPFAQFAIRRPHDQEAPPEPTPEPAKPEEPPVSVASDVAKSAGIGLVKGGIGLVSLPGTISALARKGINWFSPGSVNPNPDWWFTPQSAQNQIEKYTGKFYEPKTLAGEYAQTAGEFAPMAAIPVEGATTLAGNVAARLANVALPSITSETLGQATKGTVLEPYARFAGGFMGPGIPTALLRMRSPAAALDADPVLAGHVADLRGQGINSLDAGQVTGSQWIKRRNYGAEQIPLGPGNTQSVRAQEEFNRAVSRSFGEDSPRITPDIIDQAHDRIGSIMDGVAQKSGINSDPQLALDTRKTVSEYLKDTNASNRIARIPEFENDIVSAARNGMTGEQFQILRRNINNKRQELMRSNPEAANALADMMDHLDASLARHASPADAQALQTARTQYRNLKSTQKVVDSVGQQGALGHVSPSKLFQATKAKISDNTAARGRDPLHELARSGQAVLNKVNSSGTAENSAAIKAFKDTPYWLAAEGAGLMSGMPGVGTALAIGKTLIPAAAARTWMSNPVQRWLMNDRAVPALRAYAGNRPGWQSRGAFSANAADLATPPDVHSNNPEDMKFYEPDGAFQ